MEKLTIYKSLRKTLRQKQSYILKDLKDNNVSKEQRFAVMKTFEIIDHIITDKMNMAIIERRDNENSRKNVS